MSKHKPKKYQDGEITSDNKVAGSRSRVVMFDSENPGGEGKNEQLIDECKEDGTCTVNLIFCPRCDMMDNERIPMAGFRWAVKPENLYDSITFIRLQYECAKCRVKIDLPASQLAKLNKYSSETINNCKFPPGTRQMIKRQVANLVFP